ncbi:hypothetical protein [Rheinheimera sp.]|uniref:hypothetical protein n=1 Tax=Rheinheimera sp. TaxID=1869214 RepID=UPI0037C52804
MLFTLKVKKQNLTLNVSALVNVVLKHKLDPEALLRAANSKFEKRFRAVEQALAEQGKTPEQSDLSEMDALWQQIKSIK